MKDYFEIDVRVVIASYTVMVWALGFCMGIGTWVGSALAAGSLVCLWRALR